MGAIRHCHRQPAARRGVVLIYYGIPFEWMAQYYGYDILLLAVQL